MNAVKNLPFLVLALIILNNGFAQTNNLERSIDEFLSPLLEGNNFSGSLLIFENKETIFSKGYGLSNINFRVENSPVTKFQIASLSKSFTATAVLLLKEKLLYT